MVNDANQMKKVQIRKELLDSFCSGYNIPKNDTGKAYLFDIIDDLLLAKDLFNREVNLVLFNRFDNRILNRMYLVGSILNNSMFSTMQLEDVYSYIDSTCLEYAKLFYEVSLSEFKEKSYGIIKTIYGDVGFYNGVLAMTSTLNNLYECRLSDSKQSKKSMK